MIKENYSIKKIILWTFFAALIGCKVPHSGQVVAKNIIPPIVGESSVIYLDGLLLILPAIVVMNEVKKKYPKWNKILILIGFIILLPHITNIVETIYFPYYNIGKEVKSIDLESSTYGFSFNDVEKTLKFSAKIDNHSFKEKEIGLGIILPNELQKIGLPEVIDFPERFNIIGNNTREIEVFYDISDIDAISFDKLSLLNYRFKKYHVRVYCDNDWIDIEQAR